jgi:hypothetical protein
LQAQRDFGLHANGSSVGGGASGRQPAVLVDEFGAGGFKGRLKPLGGSARLTCFGL